MKSSTFDMSSKKIDAAKVKVEQVSSVDEQKLTQEQQQRLKDEVKKWKRADKEERAKLTIFSSPFRTLYLFISEISVQSARIISGLARHPLVAFLLLISLIGFLLYYFVPGLHQQKVDAFLKDAFVASEWIVLGVLSSIGLGTGLHTFLLYLGPFIAKVTLASTECNSTEFDISGPNAFLCPKTTSEVAFMQIFWKVQSAAFFWGLGTAIGELPPFFVARSARLAGKKLEDTQEEEDDDDENKDSFFQRIMEKAKVYVDFALGRFAFVSIILMASIPNPFFDLAGLTCGYSLVSFWTFFLATAIGKAGIKAHMQACFVIIMFSKHQLEFVISGIEYLLPFLKGKARAFFDKERAKFHPENVGKLSGDQAKSVIARIWDILLLVMLIFFAASIINSTAQTRLMEQQEARIQKRKADKIQELLKEDK